MAKYACSIAAVVLLLCTTAEAAPRFMSYSFEMPEENNLKSQWYDYLLSVSSRFRTYRMAKECGPIDDMPLHGGCIGSFDVYEPIRPEYR